MDEGEFWGVYRSESDIYGFRVSNNFIVLDDLMYSQATGPAPVPEPCTMLLMGTGLAGLISIRRRNKK